MEKTQFNECLDNIKKEVALHMVKNVTDEQYTKLIKICNLINKLMKEGN